MSSLDYLDLCRLCLVKDRVSVPIFEGEGDVRQIFLKITACLPVKVAREDKLPKKICDDCVYKVELIYQFWHTTANAEKQLLQWLGEVNMEDKQGYNVLNPNGMKPEQSNENRLDGTVMQQVSEHQNNMTMGMMDNMGLAMPMMMSSSTQQQITSVPIDNSGSSVQNVQPVAGPSTQTTHDQITQNQTNASTQQEEEEESSEEEENSDDECDGDEGLPIKEESEEDPNSSRTIEPTTFVNVSLACDEAGPSGLQQQKIADIPEMVMSQTSDVDPKTGNITDTDPLQTYEEKYATIAGSLKYKKGYCTEKSKSKRSRRMRNKSRKPRSSPPSTAKCKYTLKMSEKSIRMKEKLSRNAWTCNVCSTDFVNVSQLRNHMKSHFYFCGRCKKSFKLKDELQQHVNKVHASKDTYPCDECDAVCKCKQSLREHYLRKHTEGQNYVCNACDKCFKMKSDLYMHVQSIHGDGREAICDVCGKTYRNSFALKKHLSHLHSDRRFPCHVCGRKLATKESLERHCKLHNRRESAVCQVCGKTFSRSDTLKKHMRIHDGVMPYGCTICDKSFRSKSTYKQHLLTHTGVRPYVCDVCGQSFTQKPGLITHRKKHPGPLPPLPTMSIDYVIKDLLKTEAEKKV